MQALRLVSAARLPQDVAKLPCIQAVFPQPQGSHAICVATPAWEQHGAVVIFDCRSIDGRLFAIHLIGRTTRSGLLIAAGIAEDADVQVFIGNQPWPLVEGPSVDLVPGELILITPAGAPHHIVASLQDMLASPGDWTTRPDPAPWIRDHIYPFARILGDDDFFFFAIRPDRHRQLRQDLAAALQVSSRELVLQTAHLPYPDFAHQGTPASTVIAALRHTDFLPSRTRPAICFIDARPILLSLTWKVCPDALLDTGEIALRFAAGCPARYTFCLLNSRSEELPLGTLVDVAEGEVFTAIYRSFRVTSEDDDRPNSPPDSDEDDDADTGDDSRLRSPSAPVSTSVLAFQSEPADTGGTAQASGGYKSHPVYGFPVMWFARLSTLAVLAGTWPITPDCPYRTGCAISPADCEPHSLLSDSTTFWSMDPLLLATTWATPCRTSADILAPEYAEIWVASQWPLDLGTFRTLARVCALTHLGLFLAHCQARGSGAQHCSLRTSQRRPPLLFLSLLLFCGPVASATKDLPLVRYPQATAHALRTVPTPCRSRLGHSHKGHSGPQERHPLAIDAFVEQPLPQAIGSGDLVTLLEQSARADHTWAFLASTLLETLEEHFQSLPHGQIHDPHAGEPFGYINHPLPVRHGSDRQVPASVSTGDPVPPDTAQHLALDTLILPSSFLQIPL